MQVVVDSFCKRPADASDLDEVIDTGIAYALQSPKLFQQLAAPLRPQTRNLFQLRRASSLGATLTMTGNGESVSFVANLLDQVQRRRVSRQYSRRTLTCQEELFHAGFA